MLGVVSAMSILVLTSCGATSDAQVQSVGDTTTKQAVVAALNGTGYQLRYRKVQHLEGYEILAGEARYKGAPLQFAIEIRLAGPVREGEVEEGNPQPPIVRYDIEEGRESVGNIQYETMPQVPFVVGRDFALEESKVVRRMQIRLGLALGRLFASRFRPGV